MSAGNTYEEVLIPLINNLHSKWAIGDMATKVLTGLETGRFETT